MSETVRWCVRLELAARQHLEFVFWSCTVEASQSCQRGDPGEAQEGWSSGTGRGVGPGDGQPKGVCEGLSQVHSVNLFFSARGAHQLSRITPASVSSLTMRTPHTNITVPIHPREGVKETNQLSKWRALPFLLQDCLDKTSSFLALDVEMFSGLYVFFATIVFLSTKSVILQRLSFLPELEI